MQEYVKFFGTASKKNAVQLSYELIIFFELAFDELQPVGQHISTQTSSVKLWPRFCSYESKVAQSQNLNHATINPCLAFISI